LYFSQNQKIARLNSNGNDDDDDDDEDVVVVVVFVGNVVLLLIVYSHLNVGDEVLFCFFFLLFEKNQMMIHSSFFSFEG